MQETHGFFELSHIQLCYTGESAPLLFMHICNIIHIVGAWVAQPETTKQEQRPRVAIMFYNILSNQNYAL